MYPATKSDIADIKDMIRQQNKKLDRLYKQQANIIKGVKLVLRGVNLLLKDNNIF